MTGAPPCVDGTVLAVLVLYRREPAAAGAWPFMIGAADRRDGLWLRHSLLFDNSPSPVALAAPLPDGMSRRVDGRNVGTAGAYTAAVAMARELDCRWLLLLDQDTVLPDDYLVRAAEALAREPAAAVLVPRVRHQGRLISPASIGKGMAIRATPSPDPDHGILTAISSGLLLRRDALAGVLPFPAELWLDYVDHWMFCRMASQGQSVAVIDVDLEHDLSVARRGSLTLDRLSSILAAETVVHREQPAPSSLLLVCRRIVRAIGYAARGRFSHAGLILRHAVGAEHSRP